MNNDPNLKQKVDFSGKLDMDTDLAKVKPNDYTAAKNVQFLTNDTQSTRSHIPMLGNEATFSLGSVAVQNKTWRIYTPQDATSDLGGIFLYDQNGNLFPTIAGQVQPMEWDRNQTMANQVADILLMFTAIDGSGNTSVIAVGDHIDITTDTINGYDIGLEARTATHATPIVISDTVLDAQIMAEAYDVTLAGEMHDIASNDLLGDLMLLSTPQKNLPQIITYEFNGTHLNVITNVLPSGGRFAVTTVQAHGLVTGSKVVISGVVYTGTPIVSPNGIWIITVTGPLTFTCNEWYTVTTGYGVWTSGGVVTLYTESIGEIGVAQKDVNTSVWTYTRLLRTKQWNFRTKKQPDFRVSERTATKDSHYWTNDYEAPRCFYYDRPLNGVFVNAAWNGTTGDLDGAIEQINPNGHYSYKTIAEETKLLLSATSARVFFVDQDQAGGNVDSGNWRYPIRFLADSSLAATEWTDLTNPVPVYSAASNGNPTLIMGNVPATATPKINNLRVTGIIPGLFKYIELAGVNYVGDAIEGFIIKRVLLDDVSTTIDISHTGTETDVINLDLGTLNARNVSIDTAKNMDVVDKRMVLSNVTLSETIDLTPWMQTFTHTLFKESIDSVGNNNIGTLRMGEYQDPQNVNNKAGYMQNEIYRFVGKVKFKRTGFISQVYHIDDVIFNTDPTNSASTDPTRRLAGLPDFDLTDFIGGATPLFDTTTVYVPAIRFQNIDFDFLIDGVRVRDLIESITIERAEVLNPTILACGYAIPSVESVNLDYTPAAEIGFAYVDTVTYFPVFPVAPRTGIGEFPFISGRRAVPANPIYNPPTDFESMGKDERVVAFYSPDVWFGHTDISFAAGDKLLNHGNAMFPDYTPANSVPASWVWSQYGQWTGYFNTSGTTPNVIKTNDISEVVFVNSGEDVALASGKVYRKRGVVWTNNTVYSINPISSSLVIECTTDLAVFGTQTDRGFYYVQYYRPKTNQYGDVATGKYVSCGNLLLVDDTVVGAQAIEVFGGDTFTQLNYFKHRDVSVGGATFPGFAAPTVDVDGFSGGISFYCQNRVNAQMKNKTLSANLFPAIPITQWLETPGYEEAYQEGYTIRNQVRSDTAFNPALEQFNDLPVSFFWSDPKLLDSPTDGYRKILPLNRHDLDNTNGEIMHHGKSNGELISFQDRAFMRQFFNERGTLEVKGISEILIGDGSVMSRDGVTLSRFGSLNKWSVIHGVTANGDDVYMWINTEMKNVAHYASNGTLTVSDEWMKSFFANNLTWVEGKDTPADDEGICGVYDQRFNNFIWTVRGKRVIASWLSSITYASTNIVFHYPTNSSTFEATGEFFISKLNANTGHEPQVYDLPAEVTNITGTTTLTVTTMLPHLLLTGDQVKLSNIAGTGVSIVNDIYYAVTVTGGSTFTITLPSAVSISISGGENISAVNPKWWTLIPHTNNQYFNEYTVMFNGFKSGIITFASFLPRIYNKWVNTFLSPRPISPVSKVYLHNKGAYLTWYLHSGVSQQEAGYIEAVINKFEEQTKWFANMGIDSEVVPAGLTFATRNHVSYLLSADFEQYEDSFYSPIKEDSTVTAGNPTGLNDTNTSLLWGKYMKARFSFAVGVYQKLSNFIVNFDIGKPFK